MILNKINKNKDYYLLKQHYKNIRIIITQVLNFKNHAKNRILGIK